LAALPAASVGAQEAPAPLITFSDGHFTPQRLEVPAQKAFVLKIKNESKEVIEFESFNLNREKPIQPGETVSLHIAELSPGSYDFYDDFHKDVPEGEILAK